MYNYEESEKVRRSKKKKKEISLSGFGKKKKIYVSNKYEPSTSTRQCLKESAIN